MALPRAIIRYEFYYIGIVKTDKTKKPDGKLRQTVRIGNTERMIEK